MAKKILIIDDEPDLLKLVVARVEKAGYVVIQGSDGKNGLDMMYSEKPDLILLDLVMPGVDGYEVCRRKRNDSAIKNIPVILFTANLASKSIDEKARELGAEDYIVKPFDSKELIEKIKKLVGE